ncbi:hypothetical protein EDB19DRAFT_1919867 [Suillus lakei]|nr:hypothetical protein EDB19DRAFT_1919867 [Suillus lakei]
MTLGEEQLNGGVELNESQAAAKFEEFRFELDLFRELSFTTASSTGPMLVRKLGIPLKQELINTPSDTTPRSKQPEPVTSTLVQSSGVDDASDCDS